MARYRKIDPRVWNDEKFRALSDRGKLAFLFVLTHPAMTALGAMRATMTGLGSELGWPEKGFTEAFSEASSKGMLEIDGKASYVGAPNFVRYNPPESPNVIRAWRECIDLIPECPNLTLQIQRAKESVSMMGEGFRKAFAEAFAEALPKPCPNQEQEQEQEQDEERLASQASTATADAASVAAIFVTFQTCAGRRSKDQSWDLREDYVSELADTFPGVDVRAECRKALAWTRAKPANRKTSDGMREFLFKWMSRSQNGGRSRGANGTRHAAGGSKVDQQLAMVDGIFADEAKR